MKFRFSFSSFSALALAVLFACASTAPAQNATAAKPTVADALAFIDSAEKQLDELNVDVNRTGWVQNTYITDDTVTLLAKATDKLDCAANGVDRRGAAV